ncbi:MAG TPA: helix-turn-helix domain-containing protein [Jatrophihabitans sp.]|jgi:predicted ArsR family transcriptional regulator|nr:helix-turn-helix domain-containing protein [Jatrophihabitans sp.]
MPPSQHEAALQEQLRSVASLGEPVRRTLYRYVAEQSEPVSREQAASGVGVAHHIAKFHLDKLEEDGLLEVEYRRPAGRTGPGAGRPAKFYRRADRDIAVSVPERRYELPGRLMAEAILASTASAEPVSATLRAAAQAAGERMGRQAGQLAGCRPDPDELAAAVCGVLEAEGYEPRATFDRITLSNCPFASLAKDFTSLVCGMNLNLMRGLVEGLADGSADEPLQARLDPAAGRCCVTLSRSRD